MRFLALIFAFTVRLVAEPLDLRLPTENHHLFTNQPDRFYMYVDRSFEGTTTKPWEAGSFGYVRNAMRVGDQVILTKFHEGIDISPTKRDASGSPLDLVSSIAEGRVVYVSPLAGRSNYGKYVVVEHAWENSSIFSLYAHLAEITCIPGDAVKAGSLLGRMGYTGAGLNRTRAHLHLELAMMTSRTYDGWSKTHGLGVNFHGLFNGMNLIGSDVARFFLEHKANPQIKFSEFVLNSPAHFKVTIPYRKDIDFVIRHPWIVRPGSDSPCAWEINFTATGMPTSFTPSQRQVTSPTLTSIRPSTIPQRLLTRNLISGEGNSAVLTRSGLQLISLLTENFPITAPAPHDPQHP